MTTEFYILCCEKAKNGGGIYLFEMIDDEPIKKKYYSCDRPMYAVRCERGLCVLLRAPFAGSEESGYFFIDNALSTPSEIRSTLGVVACHLAVDGDAVYAANYISGSLSKNGEFFTQRTGASVHPTRQTSPHMHFIAKASGGDFVACDLGTDTLALYDAELNLLCEGRVPDGYGIRHLVFSADNAYIYTVNELVPSVSIFRYAPGRVSYVRTVRIPCQNEKADGAAIRILKDSGRVFVSMREENEICIFDADGEKLRLCARFGVDGSSPRDFNLIGDYLIVTNEKSGNVVGFVMDGASPGKRFDIQLPSPLCVL